MSLLLSRLSALGLLLLMYVAPATARAADDLASLPPRQVELIYEGWVGGVYMMDAKFRLRLTAQGYDLRGKALNGGLSSVFTKWRAELEAAGRFLGGRILPTAYESRREWGRNKQMDTSMRWTDDQVPLVTRSKPISEEAQLDDTLTRGSMDAVNAILVALMTIDRQQACETRVPVFDGRRRFDAILRDVGTVPVMNQSIRGWRGFGGTARKCLVDFELVAGFEEEDNPFWIAFREGRPDRPQIPIWMASMERLAGIQVPVRLQTESSSGVVVFYLREIGD